MQPMLEHLPETFQEVTPLGLQAHRRQYGYLTPCLALQLATPSLLTSYRPSMRGELRGFPN